MVNKSNYEAYLLDHFEGKLNDKDTDMLMNFLEQYPELKAELNDFELITLNNPNTTIDDGFKSELLKEESTGLNRLEYLLIAELEGQLSNEEQQELTRLAATNDSIGKQKVLFSKTVLEPSDSIIFKEKTALKKKNGVVISLYQRVAAVAAILIIALLIGQFQNADPLYNPKLAKISRIQNIDLNESESVLANFVVVDEELEAESNKVNYQLEVEKPSLQSYAQQAQSEILKAVEPTTMLPIKVSDASLAKVNDSHSDSITKPKSESYDDQYADATTYESRTHSESEIQKTKNDFVPVSDFAKQKLKENLLKNKTLSEAIADEIAKATNDKITFDQVISAKGKREKFALNIGKLKISKNN